LRLNIIISRGTERAALATADSTAWWVPGIAGGDGKMGVDGDIDPEKGETVHLLFPGGGGRRTRAIPVLFGEQSRDHAEDGCSDAFGPGQH